MKTKNLIGGVLLLALTTAFAVTNDLTGALQRGLFEEEANRNLDAAAQAYQTVSAQFDKDRKLAATAIFRLGEVYRKQNKTNEAVAQYERIVGEFADQDTLATLSRQNLSGLGNATQLPMSAVTGSGSTSVNLANMTLANLESQYALLAAQLAQARTTTNHAIIAELFSDAKALAEQMRLEATMIVPRQIQLRQAEDSGVEARIQQEQKNLQVVFDRVASLRQQILDYEELRLKSLKIAVDQIREGQLQTPGTTENEAALITDDEEKEIRRIQAMIQNSPDLINAPREGGVTPLSRAAGVGWLRVAKFLLDNGAAIQQGGNNSTPLHEAVKAGHRAMVELLLERGANLEARDGTGSTALHLAAEYGYLSVAETLVQRKADLEARNSKANGEQTPLERAAAKGHVTLVALLAGKGAELRGALALAVIGGHTDTLRKLLELGAKPDVESAPGITALSYAAERGNLEAVKILLAAKANPNAGTNKPPLVMAARGRYLEIAENLLRAGADANCEGKLRDYLSPPGQQGGAYRPPGGDYLMAALQLAVANGDAAMVKLLLQNKADANTKSHEKSGWASPPAPLTRWLLGNPEILKLFLEAGANANAEAWSGWALLSVAARDNGLEAVELLLTHGAKPDARDVEGEYPLSRAAARSCLPCVQALLKFKANPNLKTDQSGTALLAAVNAGSKDCVAALIAAGADVNQASASGWTPLHGAVNLAVKGWDSAILKLLLEKGADPNVQTKDGVTPLELTKKAAAVPGARPATPGMKVVPREELAALLHAHGAVEDLPDFKSIGVSRASSGYRETVFTKSTNDWSEYSLNEVLLQRWGLLSAQREGWWQRTQAGMNVATWGQNDLAFPDLRHVAIYRPEIGGKSRSKLDWNLVRIATEEGRLQLIPLRFGDVVEVPEEDHPVSQEWQGPDEALLDALIKSVARTVTVTVNGKATALTLSPTFVRSAGTEYNRICASFMVRSVLDESKLVRFSSDLTRVKVSRAKGAGGKAQEWVVDCSGKSPLPDLWLRDGDAIEVPEKP